KEREGHSPRTLERRSCRRPRALPDPFGRHPYLRGDLHARRPPLHHRGNGARELAPAGAVLSINRISRQGWKENPVRWDLCRRIPYTKACAIASRRKGGAHSPPRSFLCLSFFAGHGRIHFVI